jgi:ABC-type glycerol-3-phosphate transport system substrate-binding protein
MLKAILTISTIIVLVIIAVRIFDYNKEKTESPRLRFLSLAWQEQAIAANKAMVEEWNAAHPEPPVEYVQGTWNSVHDYLITAFETGDAPDVFHYESSIIVDFAMRGFLTDLSPLISADLRNDVLPVAWASVRRPNGEIPGIPFLMESFIVLYNQDLFEKSGVAPPTLDRPWSWDDLRIHARQLTRDSDGDRQPDQWGAAMGLRNSANLIMNHAISFGGSFFRSEDDRYFVKVGDEEKALLKTILDLLYEDKSMAPASIGQTGAGMLPGFFAGKYAMLVGIGAWARQQVVENAPPGFRWGVMLPLKAQTQNTGINTQTLSIPKKSKRPHEAMAFIEFMLNRQNLARLAQSDWMLPTRRSCLDMPEFQTHDDGWDVVSAGQQFLSVGRWLGAPGYVEWKNRVANPILQQLFARRLSLDEAARRIEIESNLVLSRYQRGGS